MSNTFNPQIVDLDTADPAQVICYLTTSGNEYNGHLGARISALFVILIVSTAATFFPVLAVRIRWLKIPTYVYLFARYFGAGVIVATAFIHLLDPAYSEIGPQTCVGMSKGWNSYSWPPAIVLVSVMAIFLLDFAAERYVEIKYGSAHTDVALEDLIIKRSTDQNDNTMNQATNYHSSHQYLHSGDQNDRITTIFPDTIKQSTDDKVMSKGTEVEPHISLAEERSFRQQISAFLILEFGVIVHSVIIGLNLGVAGPEFSTLYPVIVFHQSFEGLGIGARMSAIPFPERLGWMPWALCTAYGLTTPIAIAIGLGLRTTYTSGSFTANIVSGVLDSISAGILIYTGLVELLARDFLFNPERTRDNKRLTFMLICLFAGAGLMALLGKWA
ncbi:ZIP zinc/iron transport family [Glonium stellatum]|uniref:ZIP zinc/iron transport family n=1 Tax=Glonium stellatum TaxID=574774 RepID=A0A8E2EZ56_9PEZI|nr:ZIP zinc/iron transport family [Glonium stellatum]